MERCIRWKEKAKPVEALLTENGKIIATGTYEELKE